VVAGDPDGNMLRLIQMVEARFAPARLASERLARFPP
jgi:hypothetical protein